DLHRMAFGDDGAAKTYEQFRVGAMQAMEAYGPGNYLAKITSKSTFDFADLKQEKITVYITVDFANKDVLGKWAGAMLWLATDQLVRANNNVPVTIYHDENCNSPLYILPTLLTLLRSYGVKYIGATQDLEDISRVYGKPALATLLSETDVKQFLAPIRSQTTLDYLSKSLGEYTAMAESFSFTEEGVKESSSRRAQALQTAEQIRRLPKDAQIIFYSNFRPILARKVQVFAMAPLRKQIAPNSMYGGKRYLKPVEVVIRRTGARVTEKGKFMLSRSRKWPLIAEYLIARSPVKRILAGTALITLMFVLGTPHLRWEYRFTGHHTNSGTLFDCQYVGLERFTLDGPNCPVVVFRKIKLPDF
ncbi:MAG: type IV secretory system conjugative DNA transfer family protein, partial [Sneathiella sp.]